MVVISKYDELKTTMTKKRTQTHNLLVALSRRTYALAILMATVLVGCSEKPKINFSCNLVSIDAEYTTSFSRDDNPPFVYTIDTFKKLFIFEESIEHPISYTEYDDKLVSEKTFQDWEARVKKHKININKAYAEGESEHDTDSDYWKPYFDSRKEKINNDFDEYFIESFNKITGELIVNEFNEDGETIFTYAC